jgi:hypothetical protein
MTVAWQKLTDVPEGPPSSGPVMEVVNTSEITASVCQTTRRSVPQDSNLHSCSLSHAQYKETIKSITLQMI